LKAVHACTRLRSPANVWYSAFRCCCCEWSSVEHMFLKRVQDKVRFSRSRNRSSCAMKSQSSVDSLVAVAMASNFTLRVRGIITPLISLSTGPPCLAKRFSSVGRVTVRPGRSCCEGASSRVVLRSNSRSARGHSHWRDRLSQNEGGVLCRGHFSCLCRWAFGRGWGVGESASVYGFRFCFNGASAFTKGIEN